MKYFFKFIFQFSILLFSFEIGYSQIPSYTIHAKNPVISNENKKLTFDIYFTNTSGSVIEFAGAQYFFRIPQLFGTLGIGTGTNSGYQYDSLNGEPISEFPVIFRPRNPSVAVATVNGVPYYELRLAANTIPWTGYGFDIPNNVPLLVYRMKLISVNQFDISYLNLLFRDSCNDNPVPVTRTRVNFYIGTSNTEVTRCRNHFVEMYIPPPIVTCNIKLGIEGLYNPVSGNLMKKDSVSVYLRKNISPFTIIDSVTAVIDSNSLTGNFTFAKTITPKIYYIVIKYKNGLETWSKNGGDTLFPGNNYYDFTSSVTQAYGNNMTLKGNTYCIFSGNVNDDMIIDAEDLLLIDNDLFNFVTGNTVTDLNGDYVVDIEDMSIADKNVSNLVLVEWPGLTSALRKNLLRNKYYSRGFK